MLDLIVRNAVLPDGRDGLDIGVSGGRIVVIEVGIAGDARQTIDAGGRLVSPPFVDPHFHMDATLSLGTPRLNRSGTLLKDRAMGRAAAAAHARAPRREGTALLRSCSVAGTAGHPQPVDVMRSPACRGRGLLEVRAALNRISISNGRVSPGGSCAAPARSGISSVRSRWASTSSAGFRISSARWRTARLARAVQFAADRGLPVDMHCDETDDPMSRHIETLAAETDRLGLHGRVAGSHLTSMHSMDNYYVSKLIPLIASRAARRRQSADQHHMQGRTTPIPSAVA